MTKYNIKRYLIHTFVLGMCIFTLSCTKQNEWLDVKSTNSRVVPETLADFQAILDYGNLFNTGYSTAGLVGTDNLFLTDIDYTAATEDTRNLYTWNKEIWIGGASGMWSVPFRVIENSNIILDGLKKKNFSGNEYNNIKGQALFHRALAYFNLSQLFCKPYSITAEGDLGLPIRLSSDVNEISQRSTLRELHNQIILDATESSFLLNEAQPSSKRPVKATAFALLAKIYLSTENYEKSRNFALECIKLKPQLLDFNNSNLVNPSTEYRFPALGRNNPEILFYTEGNNFTVTMPFSVTTGVVSQELYQMYGENDLRKTIYYSGTNLQPRLRGTYTGKPQNFCGIGTNEVYLILSECYARLGNMADSMKQLNLLLVNRYSTGKAPVLTPSTPDEALEIVLRERRKELPFVGDLRWQDLRRLNKEPRFQKTLTRTINGVTYALSPNDPRYVLPIPLNEIQLTGLEQNER